MPDAMLTRRSGPHDHRSPLPLLPVLLLPGLVLAACGEEHPTAYGNFEAREVAVSAEATGTLVRFDVLEGDRLDAGAAVGQVDSVTLALQRDEIRVQAEAARTRAQEARAHLGSLEARLRSARTDLERVRRLLEQEAATAGELTRLEGEVESLEEEMEAARARIRLARLEADATDVRMAQLQDRIRRTTVRNPVTGTVLTTFVEAGELVQPGRILYTVAPLDTLTLRAYVSGGQLGALRLGERVEVRFDAGADTLGRREGRISWIAAEAQFTPTPIQTREERVDQVYAVKILVANPDGRLKIGMPGELALAAGVEEGESESGS